MPRGRRTYQWLAARQPKVQGALTPGQVRRPSKLLAMDAFLKRQRILGISNEADVYRQYALEQSEGSPVLEVKEQELSRLDKHHLVTHQPNLPATRACDPESG